MRDKNAMTECNWCPTGRALYTVEGKPTCQKCVSIIKKQGDDDKLQISRLRGISV